jgi:glycosyltransferase involved in cell wall biosynthesis
MRVALIHDHIGGRAGGGGGVRLMVELGVALQDLGHDVVVAVHDFDPDTTLGDAATRLDIRAVHTGEVVPPVSRAELLRRQWGGMSAVARLVPPVDVVDAHEWPASRAARLAGRRLRVPWVWTRNDDTAWERGLIPDTTLFDTPSLPGRVVRLAAGVPDVVDARSADRIVVLSRRNADAVRRAYRRDSEVVWCGPPDEFFDAPDREQARARLEVDATSFLAVAVGIMFPHRRFEDLVWAVASLPAELPLQVRIIGSDHQDPAYAAMLERLIAETGSGERIRLERRGVPQPELRDLYAGADVSVFPNRVQAYGLAPLESLASGTPVILSTGIGVSEPLHGREGVLMVDPERPDQLADALRAAMATDLRPGAAETAAWIKVELSNRRYAERMAGIFAEVIQRRRTGGPA